jgi:TatD DNase family protein
MKYIDAHCHLQFDAFNEDREEIIVEMKERDIHGIVVGVDLDSSKKAIELAEKHEHLYASVGLHPGYVTQEAFDTEAFENLIQNPNVVAVGECGLDYFRSEDAQVHELQKEVFTKQVELAQKYNKPLMIHGRPAKGTQNAYHDIIGILKSYENTRGNIHFFVGGNEERDQFEALGFTVSVTGVLTFTDDYNDMVTNAKHSMLLAETDSPYIAPVPHRGKRNSALNVVYVYEKIAKLWNIPESEAQEILTNNTKRVFNL